MPKRKEPPLPSEVVDDLELEGPAYIGDQLTRRAKHAQWAITKIWKTIPVQKVSTHVMRIKVRGKGRLYV